MLNLFELNKFSLNMTFEVKHHIIKKISLLCYHSNKNWLRSNVKQKRYLRKS